MNEPTPLPPTSSAPFEHEFQDNHWHDEEPEIQNDELPRRVHSAAPGRRPPRMPNPKRRFVED